MKPSTAGNSSNSILHSGRWAPLFDCRKILHQLFEENRYLHSGVEFRHAPLKTSRGIVVALPNRRSDSPPAALPNCFLHRTRRTRTPSYLKVKDNGPPGTSLLFAGNEKAPNSDLRGQHFP